MSTPLVAAMPPINRLELVPMRVIDPARVVMCAIGSMTSRAGMSRVCSNCLVAGMSMATIGVVFISADARPTGTARRPSAWLEVVAPASRFRVIRDTMPVCTTPLAMTSMAPTVITPGLLRPANNWDAGAMPTIPASTSAPASAITGRTRPVVMSTRVDSTMTPATIMVTVGFTSCSSPGPTADGFASRHAQSFPPGVRTDMSGAGDTLRVDLAAASTLHDDAMSTPAADPPAIEVHGLRKSFGATTVLDGISFTVPRGTVFALLGPNGAGKTTTVHILSTLLPADGGTAAVAGFDVSATADEVRRPHRRHRPVLRR